MMKNTEWGAGAYLQHSKYGSSESVRINNNASYITGYSATQEPTCGFTGTNVTCNKYGVTSLGLDGSVTINYKKPSSVVASTTGNYTGIYDMSGGSWEYTMSVMLNEDNTTPLSGRNSTSNSGFTGPHGEGGSLSNGVTLPNSKYYDTYQYSTDSFTYNRRILGDATGEMGPFSIAKYGSQTRQISSWYKDEAWLVTLINPWFKRGGEHVVGLGGGLFSSHRGYGNATTSVSFRIVLSF